ncbi:MAG: hypothetical protein JWR24_1350 [Actinoallomurus sp.]|nr:hypothetical protein [Actinoallomurus sp.]
MFPFENELRRERHRLIETLDGLTDEEFSSGPTLCAGWAPRDVLAHVVGLDDMRTYARFGGRINAANEAMVRQARDQPRARLITAAAGWADRPSLTSRVGAAVLLGDLSVHHRDIVRGLGRTRVVPEPVAAAIFREGLQLSLWLNRRVLRHRIVPTDGGRPIGRGRPVRGTRESLGLWLCGRDAVVSELEFG